MRGSIAWLVLCVTFHAEARKAGGSIQLDQGIASLNVRAGAQASAVPAVKGAGNAPPPTNVQAVYHKGQLTSGNVNFHVVYVGASAAADTALQQGVSQFLTDMPAIKSFWSVFDQYSQSGPLTGVAGVNTTTWVLPAGTLMDKDVNAYVQTNYIAKGTKFTAADVMIFMLSSEIGFIQNGTIGGQMQTAAGCIDFCGIHLVAGSQGNAVPYAVIPSYQSWPCNAGCYATPSSGNLTTMEATTLVLSHEISEVFTDTYEGTNGGGEGWFVEQKGPYQGMELADICQAYGYSAAVGANKYIMTKIWSNTDNKCMP
ncbi:hypothetical protein SeMB42_g02151 [Synchytrium endobioticum]|uniref:Uncharacterized protein n=1 Tax=Synchytrium endobioticum TaxID=286115 RepID=A0A507DGR4_9FUNG|nr:hypothetical protein SeLEV6574_g06311 [Synchytrium endobioticum]TPX50736.1 hypothetical protein SeMB42_g02151 [Synchytrium endobioticum]